MQYWVFGFVIFVVVFIIDCFIPDHERRHEHIKPSRRWLEEHKHKMWTADKYGDHILDKTNLTLLEYEYNREDNMAECLRQDKRYYIGPVRVYMPEDKYHVQKYAKAGFYRFEIETNKRYELDYDISYEIHDPLYRDAVFKTFQCYKRYFQDNKIIRCPRKGVNEDGAIGGRVPISLQEFIEFGAFETKRGRTFPGYENDRNIKDCSWEVSRVLWALYNIGALYALDENGKRKELGGEGGKEKFAAMVSEMIKRGKGCKPDKGIKMEALKVDYDILNQHTEEGRVILPLHEKS